MPEEPDEEANYGLVFPFVVCQSQGGPYEDTAFVAGCYFGEIHAILRMAKAMNGACPKIEKTIPSPLIPQMELLAMSEGFALDAAVIKKSPEWAIAWFKRIFDNSEGE